MMLATVLPPLDAATEEALRESIRRFGVLVPVLRDQDGNLIDGHHRARLAGEEARTCPSQTITLPEDDAERTALLVSINDDRRPRLKPKQRREVVVALRQNGHSLRAIAGAVGVSAKTIYEDLSTVTQVTVPERVTGLDGKSRPAKRQEPRVCACGCGRSLDGKRDLAIYATDACGHRARAAGAPLTTDRQREIANKARDRVDGVMARLAGHCDGLENVDERKATATATPETVAHWVETANRTIRVMRDFKRKMEEMK